MERTILVIQWTLKRGCPARSTARSRPWEARTDPRLRWWDPGCSAARSWRSRAEDRPGRLVAVSAVPVVG